MSAAVFVDTNVLVYARDAAVPEKQGRAADWLRALWEARTGRLSVQILQEYYAVATRKLRPGLPPEEARRELDRLSFWRPLAIDMSVLRRAWAVEERFRLSWWDALVVAAAQLVDARFLLTEDLQDGQDLDGVRVVDPFQHTPEDLL